MSDAPPPLEESPHERQIYSVPVDSRRSEYRRARAGRRSGSLVHAGEVETVDGDGTDVFGAGHNAAAQFLRGGLERTW